MLFVRCFMTLYHVNHLKKIAFPHYFFVIIDLSTQCCFIERGFCRLKEAETIEILTAKDLSEMLDVNPSTLRKYSGLIDKQNGKPFFQRDASNARIYSNEAVDMIKRVIEVKKTPNMSLEKAIDIVLLEYKEENQATVTGADIAIKPPVEDDIAQLHNKIDFIGQQLQKLLEQNELLIQDNQELRLSLEKKKRKNNLSLHGYLKRNDSQNGDY